MKICLIRIPALFLLMLHCLCQAGVAEELIQAKAAIHISSTISDGKFSVPEIVEIAKQNGIKILILTERDFMRWQYGLWPLRRIISKTVVMNSVFTYGIKRYLKEIEEAEGRNPGLVIMPGVESSPFYYWEGNPFKGNLKMRDWHKHMLAMGLYKAEDYKNLPSVSNEYSLAMSFRLKDVFRFWPILTLIAGILCLTKRKFKYKDLQGRALGPYNRAWQASGIIAIIFSLLFLLNNFPFRGFKYDQYHGEQGVGPYQNLIDYVNQKGGLSFWAHPEADNIQKRGGIEIETNEYSQDLLETKDYAGFTIFHEGYKKVGTPGGIWDEALNQYCDGTRKAPVWAIGGLAFDQVGDLNKRIQDSYTIVLIPHLNKSEVLKALQEGRMYVVGGAGDSNLILDEFSIYDSISDNKGIVGDEVSIKGKLLLKIRGVLFDKEKQGQINVKLIRNGRLVKTIDATSPFAIDYEDAYSGEDNKIYYRLEIQFSGGILITNPIFAKFIH